MVWRHSYAARLFKPPLSFQKLSAVRAAPLAQSSEEESEAEEPTFMAKRTKAKAAPKSKAAAKSASDSEDDVEGPSPQKRKRGAASEPERRSVRQPSQSLTLHATQRPHRTAAKKPLYRDDASDSDSEEEASVPPPPRAVRKRVPAQRTDLAFAGVAESDEEDVRHVDL